VLAVTNDALNFVTSELFIIDLEKISSSKHLFPMSNTDG